MTSFCGGTSLRRLWLLLLVGLCLLVARTENLRGLWTVSTVRLLIKFDSTLSKCANGTQRLKPIISTLCHRNYYEFLISLFIIKATASSELMLTHIQRCILQTYKAIIVHITIIQPHDFHPPYDGIPFRNTRLLKSNANTIKHTHERKRGAHPIQKRYFLLPTIQGASVGTLAFLCHARVLHHIEITHSTTTDPQAQQQQQ